MIVLPDSKYSLQSKQGDLDKSIGLGWNNNCSRVEYLQGKKIIQTAPGKGAVNIELSVAAGSWHKIRLPHGNLIKKVQKN